MKQCGAVKEGKFNKQDEVTIEKCLRLSLLRLDKEALIEELFAANKGCFFNWELEIRFHVQEAVGRFLSLTSR